MLAGNFKKNRVVITGATGFIGRPLMDRFLEKEIPVLGIDRESRSDLENNNIKKNKGTGRLISADITDVDSEICEHLTAVGPEHRVIFHLAGIADAAKCAENPELAFKLNVALPFFLLELCRNMGGALFVFPSTGLVYGDQLGRPATEKDPVQSASVYTATKLAAEQLICAYAKTNACRAVVVRPSNIYGPDASEQTIIGRLIGQAKENRPLKVDYLEPVRDFIYIADVVASLIRLVDTLGKQPHVCVNVSTGVGSDIFTVLQSARRILYQEKPVGKQPAPEKKNVSSLVLSNKKLNELTGWTPQTTLYEGLRSCFANTQKDGHE